MVDLTQLSEAVALKGELQRVELALDNLDGGGRITMIVISPPLREPQEPEAPPEPLASPATVDTSNIDQLEQILGEVRSALSAWRDEINQELSDIGVGGVDLQSRKQPRKKGK